MFDVDAAAPELPATLRSPADRDEVRAWIGALPGLDSEVSNAERIDQIRVLEELKAAAAAAQARISVDLDRASRPEDEQTRSEQDEQIRAATERSSHESGPEQTTTKERTDRSARRRSAVGSQIALARRESPVRGGRHLGFAQALVTEMPYTLAALTAGWLSEWRATLLVRESACLSVADRQRYDAELCADQRILEGLGDRKIVAQARKVAYRLDAESVVRRARRAESERTVTVRPAPDAMTYLTGLLPVAQGVAVFAALSREADSCRALGDSRSRGQIMADTLVERVTGQKQAQDLRIEIQLVMTDRTLLAGDQEPALIPGYGTVPAGWARSLAGLPAKGSAAGSAGSGAEGSQAQDEDTAKTSKSPDDRWIRRLYTAPSTGQLVAMESVARRAPAGLARFVGVRDQTCRTPWCDAPIRHRDHIHPADQDGPTSAANLQGLCERCNYIKQTPGWQARALAGWDLHEVELRTPTGHRYLSRAPALPGDPQGRPDSDLERAMARELDLAA